MKQKQISQEFLKFLNEKEIRKQFTKQMKKTWCEERTLEQHCRFIQPKYYIAVICWLGNANVSETEWQWHHKEWSKRFKELRSENSWKK